MSVLLRCLIGVCLLGLLPACDVSYDLLTEVWPAADPSPTPAPQWQLIAPGLEWQTLIPDGDDLSQLKVLRIDPSRYTFRVHYRPGRPLSLSDWRDLAPDALAIFNANFFTPDYHALGLVVSDGVAHGRPFNDRGGAFLVEDGAARIHSHRAGTISPDESVLQAIQGFPMLVESGRQVYVDQSRARRTRRTAIALDAQGRILVLVTPFLGPSLTEFSAHLSASDLNLDTALNLDGGGSTMFWLRELNYALPSLDRVPTIVAVYAR